MILNPPVTRSIQNLPASDASTGGTNLSPSNAFNNAAKFTATGWTTTASSATNVLTNPITDLQFNPIAGGFYSVEFTLLSLRLNKRRWILSKIRSVGGDNLAIPAGTTTATLLCAANPSRVGGSLVNTGANPLFFYLADPTKVLFGNCSVAAGFLVTNGSWDFRWGEALWSGDVSIISVLGTTVAWGQL